MVLCMIVFVFLDSCSNVLFVVYPCVRSLYVLERVESREVSMERTAEENSVVSDKIVLDSNDNQFDESFENLSVSLNDANDCVSTDTRLLKSSFKSVEKRNKHELRPWVAYWFIFGAIGAIEHLVSVTSIFYVITKGVVLSLCCFPNAEGADWVAAKLVGWRPAPEASQDEIFVIAEYGLSFAFKVMDFLHISHAQLQRHISDFKLSASHNSPPFLNQQSLEGLQEEKDGLAGESDYEMISPAEAKDLR